MKLRKIFSKQKEKKNGFTLVELIVVLVILAILAAIMVPTLIGWIDKAKEKQAVLRANNLYKAAQAVASEWYAEGKELADATSFEFGDEVFELAEIQKTALPSDGIISNIYFNGYTIVGIEYLEYKPPYTPLFWSKDKGWVNDSNYITDYDRKLNITNYSL